MFLKSNSNKRKKVLEVEKEIHLVIWGECCKISNSEIAKYKEEKILNILN